jgi:acyl carrier protein
MPVVVSQDQVRELVTQVLVDEIGVDPELISLDATLESLDVDSLDLVEVAQVVEETWGFRIRAEDAKGVATLGEAIDMIVELGQSGAPHDFAQPLGTPVAAATSSPSLAAGDPQA